MVENTKPTEEEIKADEAKVKAAAEAKKESDKAAEEAKEAAEAKTKADKAAKSKAAKARAAKNKAKAAKDSTDFGKTGTYVSVKLSLYHPYQKVRLDPDVPTTCKMDSWLKSQVDAGLIKEC